MAEEEQWASWMRSAIGGRNSDYQSLLKDLTPFLRSLAKRRCREFGVPMFESEDIVQETLLAVHMKRGTWDSTRPLIPWIATILRYKVIDRSRRNTRERTLPIELVRDDARCSTVTNFGDELDVRRILAGLRQTQRTILQCLSIDGFSVRETAEVLNMTEVAVRVSLHRTMKHLSAEYAP